MLRPATLRERALDLSASEAALRHAREHADALHSCWLTWSAAHRGAVLDEAGEWTGWEFWDQYGRPRDTRRGRDARGVRPATPAEAAPLRAAAGLAPWVAL